MNETMHLFAGGGGGLLADLILGHRPIIAVECDKYACSILRARAADGWFPDLSVWEGDVRMFDPSEYTGKVGCIHAGFPCQDISVAGKQAGVGEETRSGLYREVLRIADVVRPRELFLENVSAILSNGLGTVLADLSARGYIARWVCVRASDVGANHGRDRWWLLARKIVAQPESVRRRERQPNNSRGNKRGGKEQGAEFVISCDSKANMGNTKHNGQPTSKITGSIKQGNDGSKTWQEQANESTGPSEQYEELAYSTSIGQQGQREHVRQINPEKNCDRETDRIINSRERIEGWWESEPDVGFLVDGLASKLGRNEVEINVQPSNLSRQNMQSMRSDIQPQNNAERENSGCETILATGALQPELREYSTGSNQARVFIPCEETLENEMRGLRVQQKIAGASHRPEQNKQSTGQHSDALQTLPRFFAHSTEANEKGNCREDAILGWWDVEPNIGRVAAGVADRVGKLKALGNGQVPLQAAVAYSMLEQLFKDNQ